MPKWPDNTGEVEVETSDVPTEFLRPAPGFTLDVMVPIVGGVAPVVSRIVITKVDGFTHWPL